MTHPWILTRDPGLLLFSVIGETRSSFKKTLIRLGWEPSRSSGDSSRTSPCPSTSSFEISLNFPFLPQPQRVGSLYFLSTCSTFKIFPHEGHSNLAAVTWGRTSDFCRTTPSTLIILLRFLLLISLILICCDSGRLRKRTANFGIFLGRSNSFMAISAALSNSSGFSKTSSAKSVLNLTSSAKSRTRNRLPFLTVSSN